MRQLPSSHRTIESSKTHDMVTSGSHGAAVGRLRFEHVRHGLKRFAIVLNNDDIGDEVPPLERRVVVETGAQEVPDAVTSDHWEPELESAAEVLCNLGLIGRGVGDDVVGCVLGEHPIDTVEVPVVIHQRVEAEGGVHLDIGLNGRISHPERRSC